MTTMTATDTGPDTRQKVGLVLAGLYCLTSLPSAFVPAGDPGPPFAILVASTVLAAIGLVGVVAAWRGNAVANRIAAGAVILLTLTGLPALFVSGIPAGIRVLVGVSVVLAVLILWLMLAPSRRTS